jgi:DNA polymerase-3 subunit gamma/tau
MFENIIGQQGVVGTLRRELATGEFPRSSLFHGPHYSGKLSTALETARVLTCAEGLAGWSCECPGCRLQKELAHPHTLLLGPRYSDIEIAASAAALMRSRRTASRYLFLRAVRKLIRRFDAAILDTDDARMKGAEEKVARIEELLAEVPPDGDPSSEGGMGDLLERIMSAAAPLAAQVRGEGISIGQVRKLSSWARITASGSGKVAIIENADRMQDSARNALLKLLEEPPDAVHLLLLSTRRAAIMPTLRSRLRPYVFEQRSPALEREVMAKIFRQEPPGFESLRDFFLAWKEINPEKLAALSRRFMALVTGGASGPVDIVAELGELLPERRAQAGRTSREAAMSFLEELTARFREPIRDGRAEVGVLEEWGKAVREAVSRLDVYNMSPPTVLEALFYRMRECARGGAAVSEAGT